MKNHDRFRQIGSSDCVHVLNINLGPQKQAEQMRQAARVVLNLNGDDIVYTGRDIFFHDDAAGSGQVRDQNPEYAEVVG